jgi:predicted ATPase
VLLIVTFRPEFDPPWIGRPHVTALTINRLAHREAGVMIDRVAGNKPLWASIRQDIIERTDGIPLFVEEMTKAVLEAESEGAARQVAAVVPSPALAIPTSLHASLMARLDRLGPAKEVAQIGAAVGREFSHTLLMAVVRKPETELAPTLDRLIAAGLLFQQGVRPYSTYYFKHVLVRDTAYSTLLREPRRKLHARIAETLESQFADIAENQPELLARHWTEAGQIERAAALWGKAGLRSAQRSALVEAAEQLKRALEQIATLTATPALRREQIKLQVALITPLLHVSGYAAPETRAAVERARLLIEQAEALGEAPEDPLLLFSVLYGFWVAHHVAVERHVVRDIAAQFLALAKKHGATAPLLTAHRIMGISLSCMGDIGEGRTHLDQAIALYDPAEHRPLMTRFGVDANVSILSYRSWALWFLGYPNAALADAGQAICEAREIGQAATLIYALFHASWTYIECGNYVKAKTVVDEVVALADQKGALFWRAFGMVYQGRLPAVTGESRVHMITSGLDAYRSIGSMLLVPIFLSDLARAHAEVSQFDDAWRRIDEAMAVVKSIGETWFEADIHRVAGEIALKLPQPDVAKAEVYFERALAVARGQQAKSWELRAAISMARLWRDRGKRVEARNLLAPVYGWFTEGFDTLDLKQAKALLDGLAA